MIIPFFWKNFGVVFSADCLLLVRRALPSRRHTRASADPLVRVSERVARGARGQGAVFYQKGAFNGGFAIVDEPPVEAEQTGEKPPQ